MEKGKYGIRLSFYAVAAFIFAILGYSTALILLAGVVIVGEKDEWAGRQVIQAVCLQFVSGVISAFFGLFSFFYRIPFIGNVWGIIVSVVESVTAIIILIFAIIGLVKVAKGKEAGVPLAERFANWVYGKITVKQQPVYQQPMQQPMQPVQPMQQTAQPMQPVASEQPAADVCANCGNPLNGGAFCTKCGTPAAK